jgi:hypothetical protein
MPFNLGDIPLIYQELRRYFASQSQGALADTALQAAAIGNTVQGYDADLAAIAAINSNGFLQRTGVGSWGISDRVQLFGGNGGQNGTTDFEATADTTLDQGIYFYRNFTVTNYTVTINKFAHIFCTGNVSINQGQLLVTPAAPGGVPGHLEFSAAASAAFGGRPGFGAGTTQVDNANQPRYGIPGTAYPWTLHPFGTGGSAGYITGSSGEVRAGNGGDGGGGLIIEAVGSITIVPPPSVQVNRSAIAADGTAGTNGFIGVGAVGSASGGGGGSGGLVRLSSLTSVVFNAGSSGNFCVSARGANGGNGAASAGRDAGGGGGGGGGWVLLTAPTITFNGAASVLPGVVGTRVGTLGASPGGGYGGAFGGNGGPSNETTNPIIDAARIGRYITRAWREF